MPYKNYADQHRWSSEWAKSNREKCRISRLRSEAKLSGRHKIMFSAEEVARWRKQHSGACDVCGTRKQKILCIDHCHRTGEFRGFLCGTCNKHLGIIEKYLSNPKPIDEYLNA